jgi:hypothetical protein
MEWVAQLKHHMPEMQRQIQIFCEEYPVQQQDEQECLAILLDGTDKFAACMRALPLDAAVWPWVDWESIFHDAVMPLSTIEMSFDVLLLLFDEQTHSVNDAEPLPPHADIVREHINLISAIFRQNRTRHHEYKWSGEAETERLPAYVVLSAFWAYVSPWCLDRSLDLSAFAIQEWPVALYHPYYTPALLHQIIATFSRVARDLLVIPHRTAADFEIHITHHTLRMTPDFWERVVAPLHFSDHLERLRELGGDIEPLTWDEGQGQGVIVRLPWAR